MLEKVQGRWRKKEGGGGGVEEIAEHSQPHICRPRRPNLRVVLRARRLSIALRVGTFMIG